MTAQEKAKELVEKCYIEIKDVSWSKHEHCVVVAKQCAWIACDEAEDVCPIGEFDDYEQLPDEAKPLHENYWKEVKKQIELL